MRILASIVLVLTAAVAADAQTAAERYAGRPIESIRVLVEGAASDDPALPPLIETRVGQPLSMTAVRDSITHLYNVGRFEDVQVEAEDAPGGGVQLTFNVIPLHTVERVEFTGNLGVPDSLLRRAIVNRYGSTPPVGRAADVARTLEDLYRDRGYLKATVRPVPREFHNPDRTILTFEIDAGRQARVGKLNVGGDARANRDELLRRVGIHPGDPYQRPELQQRLTDYAQRLRKRGFYLATATFRPIISEDQTVVDLTIDLDTGPAVIVRYEGDRIPPDKLKELVPVEREGSVDEDLIEDSVERIRTYLRQQGYWKAEVASRREEGEDTLTLIFDIHKGAQYRVPPEGVELQGAAAIRSEELAPLIGLKPGEIYVESRLDAAVAAIRELYRRRGFAFADIKTAANEVGAPTPDVGFIRPAIVISEGPRVIIDRVVLSGYSAITESELRPLITSTEGAPYYQPQAIADRDAIVGEYLDQGFASIDAALVPRFTADRTRVDLVFRIQEGPQTLVDRIIITGNAHTNPAVIQRELLLKPGQPLGLEDQIRSQQRLSALGIFRRVRITPLPHGTTTRQDVLVTVDEAPATSVGYGGGIEVNQRLKAGPGGEAQERFEFAPRGFFDIGRRNLGGRNRTVDFYTRVSLRPKDATDPGSTGTGFGFSEYRIVATYRAPRAFWASDFTMTAAVEQGVRSTFNFTRKGINADVLRRVTPSVRLNGRYSFNTTRTFNKGLTEEDQATIDRLFPRVRLSAFAGAVARDTRDDVLDPERGMFLSGEGSVAARVLGGQVGFMKTYLQGFWFRRLPGKRRIVFASRAVVGLADGFPREVQETDANGLPIPGGSVLIEDLPASERFFAGGDTTIRGYALDTVGAPNTIGANGFPKGGNAVLIMNGELRLPVWRDVGAALFVDGGNVFERVTQFDVGELRGALGFGVRYRSPVGPIRLDLGFKMDRRRIGGRLEPRTALHFSIGQAF